MCAIYCMVISIHFYDMLADGLMKDYMLQAAVHRQHHVTYIAIHDMALSGNVLAGNNRITLLRASAMKTLRNLEDSQLIVLCIRMHKGTSIT